MKRRILSVVLAGLMALLLAATFIAPTDALAVQRHAVQVLDNEQLLPVEGLLIAFYIKTGPGQNDWEFFLDETDEDGWAEVWVEPHSTAIEWKAILDSQATDPNPATYFQWIDYPAENAFWTVDPM